MPTSRTLDLAGLSLRDALDLAVLVEEEAKDRYEEFAGQMHAHRNPEAASFFEFMRGNEEKHEQQLGEKRRALFGDSPVTLRREMIFDIEAPDYDEARGSMTQRDALEAALRSETKAHDFFASALGVITDPAVRELFEELRDEETEHRRLVSEQIERLEPESLLRPEDVEDDPVAQ